MNKLLTAAILTMMATTATAATLKKDYPLCATEDAVVEMVNALRKHDIDQFKALVLNGSCVLTKETTNSQCCKACITLFAFGILTTGLVPMIQTAFTFPS